jgi:hypothetical protein
MVNFNEVATKIGLASNQVEAVRALLCIQEDTFIDNKTLKMFTPDFPAVLRDWIHINNPDGMFFACPSQESTDTDFDLEILNYD